MFVTILWKGSRGIFRLYDSVYRNHSNFQASSAHKYITKWMCSPTKDRKRERNEWRRTFPQLYFRPKPWTNGVKKPKYFSNSIKIIAFLLKLSILIDPKVRSKISIQIGITVLPIQADVYEKIGFFRCNHVAITIYWNLIWFRMGNVRWYHNRLQKMWTHWRCEQRKLDFGMCCCCCCWMVMVFFLYIHSLERSIVAYFDYGCVYVFTLIHWFRPTKEVA